MKSIFKIKINCYRSTKEIGELQSGIRPDCILYTGPVTTNCRLYGVKLKKWHKAISKVIGKFEAEIPNDLHCIIYISFDESTFIVTKEIDNGAPPPFNKGTFTEYFDEKAFKKSLNNFKEFLVKTEVKKGQR